MDSLVKYIRYKKIWVVQHNRPPHEPQPSYPAPQDWLANPWTPLSCGMAGCWHNISILANSGRKKVFIVLKI